MYSFLEESDLINVPVQCFYFNNEIDQFPVRPHWHYYMEIIYMIEGTAEMYEGKNVYKVAPGEMILFHPKAVHAIYSVSIQPLYYAVFKIDISRMTITANSSPKLRSIFRYADRKKMIIHFTKDQSRIMNAEDIFHRCIMEKDSLRYGYDLIIRSDIYRLLIGILRCWHESGFIIKSEIFAADNNFDIYSITEYIDENMNKNIKVSDIAKACGMSYSHFAKKFREVYGKTCKEYIEEMRIYKVEEFLIFTDFDLTYISQETGFTDCSHMIKSFKKIMSTTPRKHRIRNRNKSI